MKASFKTVDLTGSQELLMAGYYNRKQGNKGVHDGVYEKIVVIESDNQYFALGSGDYLGIDQSTLQIVRQEVSKQTNIDPSNIVLSATHTHSSYAATNLNPLSRKINNRQEPASTIEIAYHEQMVQKIITGFVDAYNTLEEVHVGYGVTQSFGVASNRNNPDGYFDNDVHVVRFDRKDGSLMGVIVELACHPTVLDYRNQLISSDYVGQMRQAIETLYPESTCLFIQGAAGEISTRYTRRESSFAETKRLGYLLAASVLKVLTTVKMDCHLTIKSSSPQIELQLKQFQTDKELHLKAEKQAQTMKEMSQNNISEQDLRKQSVITQGINYELSIKENLDSIPTTSPIQVVSFGPFNFVGIGGEIYGEIARDIKAQLGRNTIVAGYTNDYLGYLVSREGLKQETYENYMMLYDETTHERIVTQVTKTYHQL